MVAGWWQIRGCDTAKRTRVRLAGFLALLSMLTGLSGCFTDPAVILDSLESAANQQARPVFDARLLGTWHTPAREGDGWPAATFEVRAQLRGDRNGYQVVAPWYFSRPVEGQLFQLGDRWIMQMQVPLEAEDAREHVAAWHLVGIELDGERLRVSLLSMHLGERLNRGGGTIPAIHVAGSGLWVLTGRVPEAIGAAATRVHPAWVISLER